MILLSYLEGNYDFMFHLIKKGSDINQIDGEGKSLLYHCCEKGDHVRAKILLEKDAGPQCGNNTLNSFCVMIFFCLKIFKKLFFKK